MVGVQVSLDSIRNMPTTQSTGALLFYGGWGSQEDIVVTNRAGHNRIIGRVALLF